MMKLGRKRQSLAILLTVWWIVIAPTLLVFSAWLTHVIVCLKAGAWGFLIAGAIFFPIGIVNGFGVWLGIF